MTHRTTRDLNVDNVGFPADRPVTFGEKTKGDPDFIIRDALREELLALGAVVSSGKQAAPVAPPPTPNPPPAPPAPPAPPPPPPPSPPAALKPLKQMNKSELLAVVAAEGVEVATDAPNKTIVAAIEAKRAASA